MIPGIIAAGISKGVVAPTVLWTPSEISTALWLDAEDYSTFTLAGSDINEWRDKSGNVRHVTPPGTKPTRNASLLNSKGTVVFGSTQSILQTPSFSPPTAAAGLLAAMVFRRTGEPVYYSLPICFGAVNAQYLSVIASTISDVPVEQRNSHVWRNTTAAGNSAASPSSTIASDVNYLWSGTLADAGIVQYLQGTELTGSQGAGTRDLGASAILTIAGGPASGNQLQGQLAELVLVHADLTDATRQQIEGYLAHKWGLTASLAGGHPYKTDPPYVLYRLTENDFVRITEAGDSRILE